MRKPKYKFCWWCSKALYMGGKFYREITLNPNTSRVVQKQVVWIHVCCKNELLKDYPEAVVHPRKTKLKLR